MVQEGPNLWVAMRGEMWKCAKEQVRSATAEEEEEEEEEEEDEEEEEEDEDEDKEEEEEEDEEEEEEEDEAYGLLKDEFKAQTERKQKRIQRHFQLATSSTVGRQGNGGASGRGIGTTFAASTVATNRLRYLRIS